MRQELSLYLPEWQLASMFVAPERYRVPGNKYAGRRDRKIIKNQAGRSLRTFTSGMANGATPRARPWFYLTTANKQKQNSTSVKRFLAEREAILNEYLQMSNFYRVMTLAYKDVGVFSNAAFAMLPDAKFGCWFYPFAIGTYAFACDAKGDTNMFTRDFTMSVQQVVKTYGKLTPSGQIDWSTLPEWVQAQWKSARYLEDTHISQVICPNPNYVPGKENPFDSSTKKFQSYTFIHSAGTNIPPQSSSGFRNEKGLGEKEFLKVSGYSYFPVITPRWEVQAEENYGVDGPTQMALSDVMTLQEMEKGRLEAISKLLKPPMVGPASLRRHQASILAGGITYVDDNGAAQGFKPAFEMDPKLADLIADQSEYTQAIRSAYFEDLFLMMSGQETKTHVTVAEINEKAAERMSALAPVTAQLDQDVNGKVIQNLQIILEEGRRIPPRPPELQGEDLRPEYISVLAQAAKVSMMTSMERGINFTTSVANALQDPTLIKILDGEGYVRKYLEFVAIDPSLVKDEMEFEEIRAEIARTNQMQLEAAQQQQASETAKNLSSAELGKGSLLDTMMTASQP
jgi:hypothetical protein